MVIPLLLSRAMVLPLSRTTSPLVTSASSFYSTSSSFSASPLFYNRYDYLRHPQPAYSHPLHFSRILLPHRACSTKPVTPPASVSECMPSPKPQIVEAEGKKITHTPMELLKIYMALAKFRLGSPVVMTTMVGFAMAPCHPFNFTTFLTATLGTALAVASANTFNQIIEIKHDAKMSRTVNRILPSGRISVTHAIIFGATTGIAGTAILWTGVNFYAAALAFFNIVLYAAVYTPLKRVHPINTWVGGVVGAIPPTIGWVAVTNSMDMGALALATLMFVWQIPHFSALSWGLRHDYHKAGYKMLANVYPEKLPLLTLRYCIYLLPVGALCAWSGMTTWNFALTSLIPDAYLLYYAWKFYRDNSNFNSRKLFFAILFYLPVFMALMIAHKKGNSLKNQEKNENGEIVGKNQQQIVNTN